MKVCSIGSLEEQVRQWRDEQAAEVEARQESSYPMGYTDHACARRRVEVDAQTVERFLRWLAGQSEGLP